MNLLVFLAGLMGAAGIGLAAAGAHALPGAKLDVAGYVLLIHAAGVVAATAAAAQGLTLRPLALLACGGLALGAILFAGDLGMRAAMGVRLFPGAAPAGGFVMLAGWLGLAVAALAGR